MSAIRPKKPVKPGSLKLSLAEARNLPENKKGDGFLNPYCTLGPIDAAGNHIQDQLEKTATIKRTLRPGWHQTYHFPISADFKGLMLELYNEEPKKPRFLGQIQFPPEILIDGRDLSTWFSLDKKPNDPPKAKASIKGDIYVSLFYMSFETKDSDPERYNQSFDAAAIAALAAKTKKVEGPGAPGKVGDGATGSGVIAGAAPEKKNEKSLNQIDDIFRDVRAGKPEAAHQLLNYILVATTFSETESIDATYAKNAVDKGLVEAITQGLAGAPDSNPEFRSYICAVIGRISELDANLVPTLLSSGAVKSALESVMALSGANADHMKHAVVLFNIAKHAGVKKLCLELELIPALFKTLRNHSNSAEITTYCCKALNQILLEAENTVPSKKELATAIVDCGGMSEAMKICGNLANNGDVIEQWFPLMDTCLDLAPKLDAISTEGVGKLIHLIEKHRFVIQVTGASILSRLAENDEFARTITQSGAVPMLIKILGTESNLTKYEQKSREVCLKCLNKCANYPEGIEQMRQSNLPKILDSAMRGYGNFLIIQIQGVMLIRTIAKDEEMLKLLRDINVSSLLAFAAAKQTSNTRLQKLVKEMQETYHL